MARVRDTVTGVITAITASGPVHLRAGDEIPAGVSVAGSLTEDGQPTGAAEASPLVSDPALSAQEVAAAATHGVTLERGARYVRGFLDGVRQVQAAYEEELRAGRGPSAEGEAGSWDVSQHSVAQTEEFLAAHPEQYERVIAAEAAGGSRKMILTMHPPRG